MLLKAPLPQGKLPSVMPGCRLASRQHMPDRLGDVAFEQAQPGRIIGIFGGEVLTALRSPRNQPVVSTSEDA
ncbi:hypothetical protein BH20PSE1_BH20PSE1_24620 [soil metagenome]